MVTREQITALVMRVLAENRHVEPTVTDILALFEPLRSRVGELEKEATVAGGVFRDATVRWLDEKNALRAQLANSAAEIAEEISLRLATEGDGLEDAGKMLDAAEKNAGSKAAHEAAKVILAALTPTRRAIP